MRVLSVAFAEFPAGVASAGGAEQILSILDAGLTVRGHRSMVIAAAGSQVAGELIQSSDHKRTIQSALARQEIDLIHFHGLDFHHYLPETDTPMLATLHLPVSFYPEGTLQDCRARGIVLNCVSRSQAGSSPASRELPVIANGIPTDVYAPGSPGDYILWLGRICPEKGPHLALDAAHRCNMRLLLAGAVHPYPEHQDYFTRKITPLLDDKRIYMGAVGVERKRVLLSRARCLLVTSLVAETSSLVAMEALSSGTPVVAFRRGALPEIVDDGETGFIVDSAEEMIQVIPKTAGLSRALCRARALLRFDSRRMIAEYLSFYEKLITQRLSGRLPPHELIRTGGVLSS